MTEPQLVRPRGQEPDPAAARDRPRAAAGDASAVQPASPVGQRPAAFAEAAPTAAPVDGHVLAGRRETVAHAGDTPDQRRAAESSIASRRAKIRAAERDAQRAARTDATHRVPTERRAAADNDGAEPIDPPLFGGPWRYAGVQLGQVLTWQAAAAGLLAAHRQPAAILVPVVIGCVVLIGLTAVRMRGRWLYEWAGVWLRYRARRRRIQIAEGAAATVLHASDRHVAVLPMDVDGVTAAVVRNPTGYSLVIEPVIEERALTSHDLPRLPPLSDLLPGNDPSEPTVTIQQLTLMLPAPNALNRDDAAAQSYARLAESAVPARSRTWIIAQATVTPDTEGWPELQATLVNAARRLQRRLTKAGFAPRLVTERNLVEDLTALVRSDVAVERAPLVQERWSSWGMDGALSAAYGLDRWSAPAAEGYRQLLADLERLPTMATAVALAARRDGQYVDVQAVVRVTGRDQDALAETDLQIQRIAWTAGVGLTRMNGEHVHGVRATLPAGGFAA